MHTGRQGTAKMHAACTAASEEFVRGPVASRPGHDLGRFFGCFFSAEPAFTAVRCLLCAPCAEASAAAAAVAAAAGVSATVSRASPLGVPSLLTPLGVTAFFLRGGVFACLGLGSGLGCG